MSIPGIVRSPCFQVYIRSSDISKTTRARACSNNGGSEIQNQVLMGAIVIAAALALNGAMGLFGNLFGNRFSTSPVYQDANAVWVQDRLTGTVWKCYRDHPGRTC
jgi:hypothetical protein